MQKSILDEGFAHLDPISQDKRALELARRDPTVQKDPLLAVV